LTNDGSSRDSSYKSAPSQIVHCVRSISCKRMWAVSGNARPAPHASAEKCGSCVGIVCMGETRGGVRSCTCSRSQMMSCDKRSCCSRFERAALPGSRPVTTVRENAGWTLTRTRSLRPPRPPLRGKSMMHAKKGAGVGVCGSRVLCASKNPSFLARWRVRGPAGTGSVGDSVGEGGRGGGRVHL